MDRAKLRLSEKEMDLISNADWILTKNRLMERTRDLLADLQAPQLDCLRQAGEAIPSEVRAIPPRISRGENYEGLPWLILDLPRYFTRDDQMAIRSFFWWGNGFSLTLQLGGRYQHRWQPILLQSREQLAAHQWQLCVNDDPWQHHSRDTNYIPAARLTDAEWNNRIQQHPFLKLAHFIPVTKWDTAGELLMEQYQLLLGILAGYRETL